MKKNKIHPINFDYDFTSEIKNIKNIQESKFFTKHLENNMQIINYQQEYINYIEKLVDKTPNLNLYDIRNNFFNNI